MRHEPSTYFFAGALAPIVSLEATKRLDVDGFVTFDIRDDDSPQPDEQIAQSEGFAAVEAFVAALPERDRLIIRRLFWLGDTQTSVAHDLGVSKMAISKAVKRICRQGRGALAAHEHLAFIN